MFGGGKKRKGSFGGGGGRKGGGGGAAGKNAEPTEEELQAMAEEVDAEAMEEDGDGEVAVSFLFWCWSVLVPVGIMCFWWKGRWHLAERMLCVALDLSADDAARFRMQRELQYDARLDEVQCALLCPPCILPCLLGVDACQSATPGSAWLLSTRLLTLPLLPLICCLQTAMRTEPLGLDRHCRRYWWLYCDPGFLFVEEPDGQRIGVITSKEQLDEVGARLAGWPLGAGRSAGGWGWQAGRSAGTAVGGGQQRWIEGVDVWQVGRTGSRTMACFCCPAQHTSPADAHRCPAYPPCPWLA